MRFAWRLACLLAITVVALVAYAVTSTVPLAAALLPILSVCALLAVGRIVGNGGRLFSAKRFTTATGG